MKVIFFAVMIGLWFSLAGGFCSAQTTQSITGQPGDTGTLELDLSLSADSVGPLEGVRLILLSTAAPLTVQNQGKRDLSAIRCSRLTADRPTMNGRRRNS
jgi:hypothetical protein